MATENIEIKLQADEAMAVTHEIGDLARKLSAEEATAIVGDRLDGKRPLLEVGSSLTPATVTLRPTPLLLQIRDELRSAVHARYSVRFA